jgi:hypothetical protein
MQDLEDGKNTKYTKIKASNDIEFNGRIYFIPDKYIGNTIFCLPYEYQKLYKIIFAMYLELLITNNKIQNISKITKNHLNDAEISSDKLISYIITGKIYITHLTIIEKHILENIPELLLNNINPNITEKIDV